MAFAYYNEIDPAAVEWLRWLIAEGHIADGWVDQNSIVDVRPEDLDGFTQHHFFAGIGGWSYAARLAGWPDDKPLWSASCPCQPFSVAGKGAGIADERHLWPHVRRLVRACRPAVVMGEQVAGKAGYGWFDGVSADLARENYASRYVDIPACAVDAPHIRSRGYWIARSLADSVREGRDASAHTGICGSQESPRSRDGEPERLYGAHSVGVALGDTKSIRRGEGRPEPELWSGRSAITGADASKPLANPEGQHGGRDEPQRGSQGRATDGRIDAGNCGVGQADTDSQRREEQRGAVTVRAQQLRPERLAGRNGSFWSDHEWITCHDGKARRAQPGLPMLVDGLPGRVAAWRGFGNAINPILAAEVLAAYLDTE